MVLLFRLISNFFEILVVVNTHTHTHKIVKWLAQVGSHLGMLVGGCETDRLLAFACRSLKMCFLVSMVTASLTQSCSVLSVH